MNYVNNKNVYLAGPLHALNDSGAKWRDYLTPELKSRYNVSVLDPTKMTVNGVGEVGDDKRVFKDLINSENWAGLNFDALEAINKSTGDMPLVLHGGTGIPADMIKKAISLGVSKINVNTECQLAFAAATRKYVEEGKDLQGKGFDPRKLLGPGFEAIKATVKEKMELFGSVNKA